MKIAVVGVGEVGKYYAEHWHQAGHELFLTYYRDSSKIEAFATRLGSRVTIASPAQAVEQAEVILFAPRFEQIEDAAQKIGDVAHKILIDANNPFNPERTGRADLPTDQTAAKIVAGLFPNALHVKALHNLGIRTIQTNRPRELIGFVAGDNTDAVEVVVGLMREARLEPMRTGGFATAALSEFPGPLFGLAYTREEAELALSQARAVQKVQ